AVVSHGGPAAAAGRGATLRMRGVREASIEPSATGAFAAPALSQGLVSELAAEVDTSPAPAAMGSRRRKSGKAAALDGEIVPTCGARCPACILQARGCDP